MTSVAEARSLLEAGRSAEAERAYEHLLERSPDHVEALNMVALAALRDGKLQRAYDLLERAEKASPGDPVTQHHIGRVLEAAGDLAGALVAYAAAVRARPEFHNARLHLAHAMERGGDPARAALHYARALQGAQAQGRWLDAATTAPGLRPLVEHAADAVREHRREALFRVLAPIAARQGQESIERVARALRIYLSEETADFPDLRQRPTFLYLPGLPTSAYLDRALFPWIEALEAETQAIRSELLALLSSDVGPERVFHSEELERQNLRGLDAPPSWNGYYFYRHGERHAGNCAACPRTAAALGRLPLSHVREHGPEVLFSVFTPGTHLLPHRGVTNTRLVAHLPLIVPEGCALNVGGEIHDWREGRVVVFDDTYEHEAWNRGTQNRVVLIFDVWNPHLTETERAAVAQIVETIGDLRAAIEAA
jgi:aspartate beta-hydroxylase